MSVRAATPADLPQVHAILCGMHRETIYRQSPLNPAKLMAFLRFAAAHPEHCLLLDVQPSGAIDGIYIGNVSAPFFTDELTANDVIFYVVPQRRGSLAAFRLWRAFIRWAAAKGAKRAMPGISTGVTPERTGRFYRAMGLTAVGEVFAASIGELLNRVDRKRP